MSIPQDSSMMSKDGQSVDCMYVGCLISVSTQSHPAHHMLYLSKK